MADSRLLVHLRPDVATAARELISRFMMAQDEAILTVTSTLRDLDEQARLWRQGRTRGVIATAAGRLRADGYSVPAAVLLGVAPQSGAIVTRALPGFSYHQYGLAFDVAPQAGGRILWDRLDLFDLAGGIGEGLGLEWGGRWKSPDRPHFQAAGVDVHKLAAERLRDGNLRGLRLAP